MPTVHRAVGPNTISKAPPAAPQEESLSKHEKYRIGCPGHNRMTPARAQRNFADVNAKSRSHHQRAANTSLKQSAELICHGLTNIVEGRGPPEDSDHTITWDQI